MNETLEKQEVTQAEADKMGLKEPIYYAENKEEDLMEPITFDSNPSEKKYLIFYIYSDDEGNEIKDWEYITGRTNFYEFIKAHAETMDMYNSKALAGNLTLEDAVSIYDIVRSFKEQGLFENDGFEIEEYI